MRPRGDCDDDETYLDAHEIEYLEFVNGVLGKFAALIHDRLGIAREATSEDKRRGTCPPESWSRSLCARPLDSA